VRRAAGEDVLRSLQEGLSASSAGRCIRHDKEGAMKIAWQAQACGCVKARLPIMGKVAIRCERHPGKRPKKRLVCHFEDGMVRRG